MRSPWLLLLPACAALLLAAGCDGCGGGLPFEDAGWGEDAGGARDSGGAPSDSGDPEGDASHGDRDDGGGHGDAGLDVEVDGGADGDGPEDDAGYDDGPGDDAGYDDDAGHDDGGHLHAGDDGGPLVGGVWMEISYAPAWVSSATSPEWTFSLSPGFGEAEWAVDADGYLAWPVVWDIYDSITVVDNAWGQAALIDGNDRLQWMFGLAELTTLEGAVVEIWGSGRYGIGATVSVENPLFGCGTELVSPVNPGDMLLHATIDLTGCIVAGEGVQAVRVEQVSGAFTLQRMRLTLYGTGFDD